jgi:hypothetical protein
MGLPWEMCKEEVRCYNIMILSKNELRSSSGRIRYRVRVRAGIDYGVPLQCPTYVVVVPFMFLLSLASACSTIRVPCLTILLIPVLFACPLSAVLGPVRVFAVRCSHVVLMRASSLRVVLTLFPCADTSRLLYPALHRFLFIS